MLHIVSQIGECDFGFGTFDANSADEQSHLAFLLTEHMFNPGRLKLIQSHQKQAILGVFTGFFARITTSYIRGQVNCHKNKIFKISDANIDQSVCFGEIMRAADLLNSDFNYVQVDLYEINN